MSATQSLMETFVAVVHRGSFSEAGRHLEVPASTVSRQVSRLEEHLGVQLLQRSTRELVLTPVGREYFERVERIVEQIREAEDLARAEHAELRGRLRVALPSTNQDAEMHAMMLRFAERYPGVELDLMVENRVVDLLGERVDVALRAGHLKDSGLKGKRLGTVRQVLVASGGYLESRGRPRAAEELEEHDGLMYASGGGRWPRRAGGAPVEPRARLKANDLTVLRDGAVRGLGMAMLPELFVRREVAAGGLELVLPEQMGDEHGLWLVYHPTRYMSGAVRAFIDEVSAGLIELIEGERSGVNQA